MIKRIKRRICKSQYKTEEDFRIAVFKEIKQMDDLGYGVIREIEEKKSRTYLMEYEYKEGKI